MSDRWMADEAVIETSFDAAPEELWDALTSKDGLEEWMGEGSVIDPEGDLWLRDFTTGESKKGTVRTFDPRRMLEFDWWPEGEPEQSSWVRITLEPLHTGTRLTVIERQHAAASALSLNLMEPVVVGGPGAVSGAGSASVRAGGAWNWRVATMGVTCGERCLLSTR